MTDMVDRVVEVLDEGSPYLYPGRILRSRLPKKQRRQRKIKPILPAKTTGERETHYKSKERDRKEKKELAGHTPLRWDGHSWIPRKRDSDYYKEKLRNHTSRKEEVEAKLQHLSEISIRTVGIGISLGKIKQYANKVDTGIQKIKSLGNTLKTAKNETDRNRIHGEIAIVDADVLSGLRSMEMYSSLLTASGLVGLEKTLIKKLKSTKRR